MARQEWNLASSRLAAAQHLHHKALARTKGAWLHAWHSETHCLARSRKRVAAFANRWQRLRGAAAVRVWCMHSRREVAIAKYLMLARTKRQVSLPSGCSLLASILHLASTLEACSSSSFFSHAIADPNLSPPTLTPCRGPRVKSRPAI